MKKLLRTLAAVLAPLFLLSSCTADLPQSAPNSAASATVSAMAAGQANVWFFDVGQGDSELVQLPDGKNLLIDAGTPECAKGLVKLLRTQGVSRLDLVIATHPHADHIGGMQQVLEAFPVGQYCMPRVADTDVPTTTIYTTLLQTIKAKNIPVVQAKPGLSLLADGNCSVQLLAPKDARYKALNNYSAVAMVIIGQKRFLFTGDAQKESEQQMLKSGQDLHADVLKCGHHGSKTSTSPAFLKAVAPTAAVISCGRNNDYGFPPTQTLSKLRAANVTIYRTDEQKTIRAQTDGKTIRFQTGLPSATAT